ncbi:MAG TPA: DUF456 domain-containing protein [Candidatus Goldiibacteriota bacterium]|nr:DUF456 domain-containing protein [Candidatus Goldiibacteriota bacterium]
MEAIDIILTLLAGLCVLLGLIGCVVPFIPGPPLSFFGILLLHFSKFAEFSLFFLIAFGAIAVLSAVLDNILPVLGVQKTGGSRRAVTGSLIGLFAGIFILPPLGMVIFPFLGALVAELTAGRGLESSLKTSFGTVLGLLAGIALKLAVSGFAVFYYVRALLLNFTSNPVSGGN